MNKTCTTSSDLQYLTRKHVAKTLGVHPTTVSRWVLSNGLPSPIELGPNRTVWSKSEIIAWCSDKERNARLEAGDHNREGRGSSDVPICTPR